MLTGPTHGTLQLAADGSFFYAPAAGFTGIDSFTYSATDTSGVIGNAEGLVYVVPVVVGASTTLNLGALTPEEQIAFARYLTYNPWHCMPEHRPLGNQSRTRYRMYKTVAELRQKMNNTPHLEPTGDEVFP